MGPACSDSAGARYTWHGALRRERRRWWGRGVGRSCLVLRGSVKTPCHKQCCVAYTDKSNVLWGLKVTIILSVFL